jgi:hypothetical protein
MSRVLLTCDSGEERWRSEGVQVGGVRSQRGVVGTWFDKDMNAHGPAGPTAFWKVCDSDGLDSEGSEEGEDEEFEDDEDAVWILHEL